MNDKWIIFCEESGDKSLTIKGGTSLYYVISSIMVNDNDVDILKNTIETYKYKTLRLKRPLEWKNLDTRQKNNDKLLSSFLRKVENESPYFLVSNVICSKAETNGKGFKNPNYLMNYLYGLMFKRLSFFLKRTNSNAKLIIDRNTDKMAQTSLREYISTISRTQTGEHPRHSKPQWLNPEDHPILGLSDFISGLSLRSLSNYLLDSNPTCKSCTQIKDDCIYKCSISNFSYSKSYNLIKEWNYAQLQNWDWKGLLYHPNECKDDYRNIFQPK